MGKYEPFELLHIMKDEDGQYQIFILVQQIHQDKANTESTCSWLKIGQCFLAFDHEIMQNFLALSIFARPYHTHRTRRRSIIILHLCLQELTSQDQYRSPLRDNQGYFAIAPSDRTQRLQDTAFSNKLVIDSWSFYQPLLSRIYQVLCDIYSPLNPMSAPNHTFGLTRRNAGMPL